MINIMYSNFNLSVYFFYIKKKCIFILLIEYTLISSWVTLNLSMRWS